jgi:hypothetical protein
MTERSSSLGARYEAISVANPTFGIEAPRAILMVGVDGDLRMGVIVVE